MTPAEAAALLVVASAYDNRKVTEEAAEVWADALRDLPFADCRDAAKDHYRDTTDWLMPAHVRRRVTKIRATRIAAAGVLDVPAGLDPDDTGAYAAHLAATRGLAAAGVPVPPPASAPKHPGRLRALFAAYSPKEI